MNDARTTYRDIIDRQHPISRRHLPMSRLNRAAQFAPFAALTGYDDMIRESARYTEHRTELDEDAKETLNRVLVFLTHQIPSPQAIFTLFVPDAKKEGGAYITVTDSILRCDEYNRTLTLAGGRVIPIDSVVDIVCDEFDALSIQEG